MKDKLKLNFDILYEDIDIYDDNSDNSDASANVPTIW